MTFDVEADWTLNVFCNYDCDYCFSSPSSQEHPLVGRLTPEQYLEFFDSTGKVWMLHLTGGEPFFHPDFVGLCRALTSHHYISLNSNLASPRVREFAVEVDSQRVQFVHCGVHAEERDNRRGWRELLANVQLLVERGFPVFGSLVMTPSAFSEYPRVACFFKPLGVTLIPKALRGRYQGRWYPQAYSEAERAQFRRFSEEAEEVAAASSRPPWRGRATINPLLDRDYLNGIPDFAGVGCSAGRLSVSIGYDGSIFRCGQKTLIGNIFKRRLDLHTDDRPCDDEHCPYWCLRYSRFLEEASTSYRLREAPTSLDQALVTIRGVRREIGNRVMDLSHAVRSLPDGAGGAALRRLVQRRVPVQHPRDRAS